AAGKAIQALAAAPGAERTKKAGVVEYLEGIRPRRLTRQRAPRHGRGAPRLVFRRRRFTFSESCFRPHWQSGSLIILWPEAGIASAFLFQPGTMSSDRPGTDALRFAATRTPAFGRPFDRE